MANETQITIVGNATADPELRFISSGAAVATFTVASTPRIFDKATNEWKDGEALFLRVNVWREHAENVAETITKGTRVVVVGRLEQRSYTTKEGEKRTVYEITADEVAPSLRYATAQVTKTQRRGGNQRPQGGYSNAEPRGGYEDPWASPPVGSPGGGYSGGGYDQSPPF